MANAVPVLQQWFNSLSRTDQQEVLEFLYGGRVLKSIHTYEGTYLGPDPNLCQKGLFTGPAPAATAQDTPRCSQCGRPY